MEEEPRRTKFHNVAGNSRRQSFLPMRTSQWIARIYGRLVSFSLLRRNVRVSFTEQTGPNYTDVFRDPEYGHRDGTIKRGGRFSTLRVDVKVWRKWTTTPIVIPMTMSSKIRRYRIEAARRESRGIVEKCLGQGPEECPFVGEPSDAPPCHGTSLN